MRIRGPSVSADGVNARTRRKIESFRLYAVDQIEAALVRAAELDEIDAPQSFRELAEFILITMWGAKATIRHVGSPEAAAPVSRILRQILREPRPPRSRSERGVRPRVKVTQRP